MTLQKVTSKNFLSRGSSGVEPVYRNSSSYHLSVAGILVKILFFFQKNMKKSKNVLLIVLPYMVAPNREVKRKGVRSYLAFPYGLLTVASYLQANSKKISQVSILDLNLYTLDEVPMVLSKRLDLLPDIVGISFTFDVSYNHVKTITEQIKAHDEKTIVVMGGPAATVSYAEILEKQNCIDAICYTEGELAMCRLVDSEDPLKELASPPWITVKSLAAKTTPKSMYVENLNDVIRIDYNLVEIEEYSMKEAFSPFASYRNEPSCMLPSQISKYFTIW